MPMKKLICAILCLLALSASNAQYKNDNVLYKTVYWDNVCSAMNIYPGYLILDVRSKGEYADTSSYKALNIGHLNHCMNIPIQDMQARIGEIAEYKNKPVFVYCSHSQRSRRVSKMLADSGFKAVYNINGGLTDLYTDNNLVRTKCLKEMIIYKNKYQFLSVGALCKILSENKEAFVLDVRSDAAWQHKDSNAKWNAYGNFKKAVHIQLSDLYTNLSALPRDQQIILTDLEGDEAVEAADFLTEKGFKNVAVLMDGVSRWYATSGRDLICKNDVFVPAAPYSIVGVKDFVAQMQNRTPYVLIDTRSASEFNNTDDTKWKNMGHIKTAINIPAADIKNRLGELETYQNKPVLLYAGGNSAALYAAADTMVAHGFKNVFVLGRGVFDVRWTGANVKGMEYLMNWVIDVPDNNY